MTEPRVWLITGASSGLGRALTEAALAAGEIVAGAARSERSLQELAAIDRARASAHALDVADADELSRWDAVARSTDID